MSIAMDELLKPLPPFIDDSKGRAWLTFGTSNIGWSATYADYTGRILPSVGEVHGITIYDCINKLKDALKSRDDLIKLLNAPTVEGEPADSGG